MKTDILVPCIVAKLSLENLTEDLINFDLVPNSLDSGIISSLSTKKFRTTFKLPKRYSDDYETICPMEGDKMYGSYRDKMSITKVAQRYVPFVIYKFKNKVEVDNFSKFLDEIGNDYFVATKNRLFIQVDFINNESTDRDNVGAIMLDSCLMFESIVEDKDIVLSTDEFKNYDLNSLAKKRKWHQRLVLVDLDTKKVVHNFGEVPILIEEFFWQPQHSNRYNSGFRNCEFKYSQALDGIKTLVPALHETIIASTDYSLLKEELLILGMDMDSYSNFKLTKEELNSDRTIDEEIFS